METLTRYIDPTIEELQKEVYILNNIIVEVWKWVIYKQQHSFEPYISTDELDEILEILKGSDKE